jgi:hypothetical protein
MPLVDRIKLSTLLVFMKVTSVLSVLAFLAATLVTPTGMTVPEWWLLSTFGSMIALSLASLIAFGVARSRGAQASAYYALLSVLFIIVSLIILG